MKTTPIIILLLLSSLFVLSPGNAEAAIDREIDTLLARESGWLIFNTHGLDDEGWGPIRASYLEHLLDRLLALDTVEVRPAGKVLTGGAL